MIAAPQNSIGPFREQNRIPIGHRLVVPGRDRLGPLGQERSRYKTNRGGKKQDPRGCGFRPYRHGQSRNRAGKSDSYSGGSQPGWDCRWNSSSFERDNHKRRHSKFAWPSGICQKHREFAALRRRPWRAHLTFLWDIICVEGKAFKPGTRRWQTSEEDPMQ